MPEPIEQTLDIRLTLKEAIVAWSALGVLGEDMRNPTPYRIRAAELSTKLMQHIMTRWPHMGSDGARQVFQDINSHRVPR